MTWQQVLDFFNNIPADVYNTAGQLLIAGIATSPIVLGLKKWLNVEIAKHKELIAFMLTTITSLGATAVLYILNNDSYAPYLLAATAPITFFVSQPVYYLAVKPLSRKISAYLAAQVAAAVKLNSEQATQRSAAVPDSGLPIGSKNDTVL